MNVKRSLLVSAAAATVALGGAGTLGLVSADTNTTTPSGQSSLVDQIASKFNLNKADVQAVFDQNRAEHEAARQAQQKEQLAQAVSDGKLTQAQADHISQVMGEIQALRGTTAPKDLSKDTRDQIKTKLDDLHTWAKQQNIDLRSILGGMHGMHGPHGDMGRHDGDHNIMRPDNSPNSNTQ